MLKAINTKVLLSGAVILVAAAVVIGATFAFFSDTETSTGNTFTAGAIDLTIDNESYVIDYLTDIGNPTGALVANSFTSWTLSDLTIEKFFNFEDLKPGDYGEDTISLHVENNDAYLCAAARITSDLDNTITEPEDEVSGPNNDDNDGTTDGDLDSQVNIAFWGDDGDNVFEVGENVFLQGPISGMGQVGQIALADTQNNVWGTIAPVPGASTQYIGKEWCFGTLTPSPIAAGNGGPIARGTGFTCSGAASIDNIAQTDSVVGDLQFYAVQSRNNTGFTCSQGYIPVWPAAVTPTPTLD
ncbi:MAG: TasA family protein [Patescibacteria group bacterium]